MFIVCDSGVTTELSSCDQDGLASETENVDYLALDRKIAGSRTFPLQMELARCQVLCRLHCPATCCYIESSRPDHPGEAGKVTIPPLKDVEAEVLGGEQAGKSGNHAEGKV